MTENLQKSLFLVCMDLFLFLFPSNSTCIPPSIQPQIKEENKQVATAEPPPPLSALPGGFLKQLVRETEKEIKPKEPEAKDERPVSVWFNVCLRRETQFNHVSEFVSCRLVVR